METKPAAESLWYTSITKTGKQLEDPEMYLESIQTCIMESFRKNSEQLLAVTYFRKKKIIIMFDCVLSTSLDLNMTKHICNKLRNLVQFVQFKKREKHPWRRSLKLYLK